MAPLSAAEIREKFSRLTDELATDSSPYGGAQSVRMDRLRDAVGAGRLAQGPCSQISYNLEQHGLGSSPQTLPTDQHASVLLFKRDSPLGRVIQAAAGTNPDSDEQLRHALRELFATASTGNSEESEELDSLREIVDQIRALLG